MEAIQIYIRHLLYRGARNAQHGSRRITGTNKGDPQIPPHLLGIVVVFQIDPVIVIDDPRVRHEGIGPLKDLERT